MPPVNDPLLKQTLAKVEASVPEKYQKGYNQIMAAGLQAMFSEKTFPLMEDYLKDIKSQTDIPNLVAHGIIKLLSILFNESKGQMQLEASGAAAIALMTHALDYVEQVIKIEVTKEILAQTTELVRHGLMVFLKQASKLSDEDFNKALTPKQPGSEEVPVEEPAPAEPVGGVLEGA
jgi:hypothetical protein